MRRYLLFLLLFCMHCIARGQTIYDYRYWFDNDYSLVMEGRSLSGSWQFQADLTGLSESLHAIHIQVTDTTGVMSSPVTRFFVKMRDINVKEGRYWFDNDVTTQRKSDAVQGIMDIDVTALREGFHTFHYQVMGTDGYYSLPVTRSFYKVLVPEDSYYRCWVDEDYSTLARGKFTGSPILVDITSISEGYHQLRVQIDGSTPSSPVSHSFVKIPQTEGVDYLTCLCSVDDNLFRQEQVASTGGIINWNFDVSELSQGFHRMQVQVVTPSGAATSTYDAFFLRTTLTEEINDMKCVYCVDGAEFYTEAGRMSNGAFHCDLDVSTLTDGLHRLSYYLTNGKGVSTKMSTQFFLKTPVGGNGIMQYQYWVNDRDDQKHVVTLDQRTNPFSLVKLLPVETQPIRSSNFQFVMKNSSPLIYARNEFHIRFYDTSGRMVEETKEYYDEQVSAAVEPVGELQATQTFNKIANSTILWYTMQAAPGDTVAFKLTQPATVQLFAPSGAEVFKTTESASTKWGGIHTWEDGTYYLAVHDVTGSQSTMKLEYMHMDKYDVVDWDVHRVGNGGCSTITFKGNGFRDLYAVDLYNAQGDSVKSVAVGFIDDANVSVTFNFTDVPLGNYDAIFHFTTEDKTFHNILTVEEATDIELALDVQYPSSFLRGTSTRYTITVTNKGNSTAYDVPLEICLSASSFEEIESVFFKDINGNNIDALAFDFAEEDSISVEDKQYFMDIIQSISGLSTFVILKDTVRSIEVGFSDRLITIPPKQNYTVNVVVRCSSTINLHATIPSEWYSVYTTEGNPSQQTRRRAPNRDLCCEKEKWECIVSSVADVTGVIPKPLFDCIPSLIDLGTFTAFEIMCGNGNTTTENIKNYFANLFDNRNGNQSSAIGKWGFTALGCIGLRVLKMIDKLKKELEALRKSRTIAFNQAIEYDKIYAHLINQYDDKMKLADEFYNQGNINKAEELAEEAKGIKNEANLYKQWRDDKVNEVKVIEQKMNEIEARIDQENIDLANIISFFKNGIKLAQTIKNDIMCTKERLYAEQNCPPDPKKRGGSSTPAPPSDPNEIYGYLSEAGSKFIADSVARVNYTIEFENDTTFATAAAHTIVIKDTLDNNIFDLTKFMPTGIRIGEREAFLDEADVVTKNNVTSFVKTIDMRPEINAIAQVDGTINQKNGIAQWTLQSLDPMTMEPTDDLMQGILPVNYNGTSGIGEVMFEVGVKQGKADGTQIKNRAGIVFDYEEAILTPTWTNIVDAVAPSSVINDSWMVNDSTLRITADGFDARSGVWKYEWYVQAGENAPWWKEGETESASFDYHIYEGIDYGFCVLAVDSAGNVEQKLIQRERGFKTYGPDYEDNIDEVDGQQPIVNGQSIYDLSGRKHDEPQEGVNIIDKKKVLFRRKGK